MYTSEQVMQIIKDYLGKFYRDLDLTTLESQKVANVLTSSFEVVELSMEIEDGLGIQEDLIDLEEFAAKFALISFGDLAEEIASRLNQPPTSAVESELTDDAEITQPSS